MQTSVTSMLQLLRELEELVRHEGIATEELHRVELELRENRRDSDDSERSQSHARGRRHKGSGQVRGKKSRSRKTVLIRAECDPKKRDEHALCSYGASVRFNGCIINI
jgi:ribosomal protein S13